MDDVVINKEAKKRMLLISRLKRRLLSRHIYFVRFGFLGLILVGLFLIYLVIKLIFSWTGADRYVKLASVFIFTPSGVVREIDNRTNILLLGKAGEGYTAPELTDTMILMSVNHDQHKVTMISLPRDLWISSLRTKLNSVYYYGNKKQEKGGLILAKATVEELTGVPVQYAAVIDFSGFQTFIDELGGIKVDVERGFKDERYPIAGRENDECSGDPEYLCRYETIEFKQGVNEMDGETALKYVRSRQSKDEIEGTDFGRAARQRKVIDAVLQKLQDRKIMFSYGKLKKLYELGGEMVETDIEEEGLAVLARIAYESRDNLQSIAFNEELLVNPTISLKYDNLYVFVPKYEIDEIPSFNKIQDWFNEQLD